jgi:hypothetical protein
MKMFSLLALCLCVGFGHASARDIASSCPKGGCVKIKKSCIKKGAMGFAAMPAECAPFCLQSGTIFNSLEAKKLFNMGFADGEFTIQKQGSYLVNYFARINANRVNSTDSITLGVCVNGNVVQEGKLFPVPTPESLQYPFVFSAKLKMRPLALNEGDKVSLKVVDMALSEGGEACVICDEKESRSPVALMLYFVGKKKHQQE